MMAALLALVTATALPAGGQENGIPARSPGDSTALNAEAAQPLDLSLDMAVARALGESQEIQLAESRVSLAEAQVGMARSMLFPQINANLGYTRTLASVFDTGDSSFSIPDSLQFNPDPTAALEDRVTYLEENADLAGLGGLGALFGNLPFGQENAYTATLSGEQTVWSGGRMTAGIRIAREAREAARHTLTEEAAEIGLQVRTAYYQALLADELELISMAAVEQAQAFLAQEQLRLTAGRASELEVLRAEVELENLRPELVAAGNAAELARLNLKRLTDIPTDQPLRLTTTLTDGLPDRIPEAEQDPTLAELNRASVAAAENQVAIREEQVNLVRGSYLPNVALRMNYGKQVFPAEIFGFDGVDWRTDWTATLNVSVPVFDGFRRGAEMAEARVQLNQARLQVAQLREAVQIEYAQARGEKARAQAAIAARQRTVEQAQRVNDLTVLRYDQGLATQLEVTAARLSLLQSRTNLAQAIADYYIADIAVIRAIGDAGSGQP